MNIQAIHTRAFGLHKGPLDKNGAAVAKASSSTQDDGSNGNSSARGSAKLSRKRSGPYDTVIFSRRSTFTNPQQQNTTAHESSSNSSSSSNGSSDSSANTPDTFNTKDEDDSSSPSRGGLASIIHQSDGSGKQKIGASSWATASTLTRPAESTVASSPPSHKTNGFNKFISNIYNAFGMSHESQHTHIRTSVPKNGSSGATVTQEFTSTKYTTAVVKTYNVNQKNKSHAKNENGASEEGNNHAKSPHVLSMPALSQYPPGLLPSPLPKDCYKKCLVLDLDETLVHSSFKPTINPDYIIPVEIDGTVHQVYVSKRPGVDRFLYEMSQLYEIVVFTASLSKYADPLLDQLDIHRVIRHRLFREHCVFYQGTYVKDLSMLARPLPQTIIVDNSPAAYWFHPENAIGCSSYIDDCKDDELLIIENCLKSIADKADVREFLAQWRAIGESTQPAITF